MWYKLVEELMELYEACPEDTTSLYIQAGDARQALIDARDDKLNELIELCSNIGLAIAAGYSSVTLFQLFNNVEKELEKVKEVQKI